MRLWKEKRQWRQREHLTAKAGGCGKAAVNAGGRPPSTVVAGRGYMAAMEVAGRGCTAATAAVDRCCAAAMEGADRRCAAALEAAGGECPRHIGNQGATSRGSREARQKGLQAAALTAVVAALAIWCWLSPPGAAAETDPGSLDEIPVATGAGDQVSPSVSGSRVVFNDLARSPDGWAEMRDIYDDGFEQDIFGPGLAAGPVIDGDAVAWQDAAGDVCLWRAGSGVEASVSATLSGSIALDGDIAVLAEGAGGSIISRVNFATGYSKKVDTHSLPDMRFDPDIDGDQAVWVRMRGYGSQYYEPLIVSYDVASDTWSYLTRTGGGQASGGGSLYQRRHPAVSGGTVLYQQRLNEPGETWDIYQAQADTFGIPLVEQPGDQINPAFDGRYLVYQDNRGGHFDENGNWTGEWDLYLLDLDTGIERPLCTAPGDQVKPSVRDGVVVWQDNRNGDWDIYAAVIEPEGDVSSPELALFLGGVSWNSYSDYLSHFLTVNYHILNRGSGPAQAVTLELIDTTPGAVSTTDSLPLTLGPVSAGGETPFDIRYLLPEEVLQFSTSLYARCLDGAGNTVWFPGQPG